MKVFYVSLLILMLGLLSGCNLGSVSSAAPTATPRPTVALQAPELTPTQIKPIESQPTATPILDAPVIAYNDIKEGQLTAPSVANEWVFNAKAGDRVNIILNSQFDSYLEVFAPNGEFIAANDDSGNTLNAALFDLQLKQSGPHTIVIHGFDGAIGGYALALTGGHPTIGGGIVADGDSRTVMLPKQGFKWRYQGRQGAYLTAAIKAQEQVDSRLSLYGPDGNLLAGDDDSGGNLNPEIYEFPLPVDGTYTLQAKAVANTGLVTLNVNSSAQSSGGGPIAMGETRRGTLKPGRSHRWSFTGQTGQIITLNMTSPDFDAFFELRNSQDVILTENFDSQNDAVSTVNLLFPLPADDTYTVLARGLYNDEGGDYDISLKLVDVAPGGGPLVPQTPTQALLSPGQTNAWTFEAAAGTFIAVTVQSDQFDAYIELYGPDDTPLTQDNDSGGGLNAALLDFPITESGKYRLAVKSARTDKNEGGVYEILLTLTESLEFTGRLESGQSQTSAVSKGEQHTWVFEAETGAFITVQMDSDVLDTYLALYDDSGELLTLNDDFSGTNAAIANFVIPEDGRYRIIARPYSAEQEGGYTITLQITDEALSINPSN